MGRPSSLNSSKFIVSVRVNAEERQILDDIAVGLGVNISTLLRKSLNLIAEEVKGPGGKYLRDFAPGKEFQ